MSVEEAVQDILNEAVLQYAEELDRADKKRRREEKRKEQEKMERKLGQLKGDSDEMTVPETARTEQGFERQFIGVETPELVEAKPRVTQAEEEFRRRFIARRRK